MVEIQSFKRLILRVVLRQVSPMIIRLVSVSDQIQLHDVFRTILGWRGDLGYIIRVHGQEFNSFRRKTQSKARHELKLHRPGEVSLHLGHFAPPRKHSIRPWASPLFSFQSLPALRARQANTWVVVAFRTKIGMKMGWIVCGGQGCSSLDMARPYLCLIWDRETKGSVGCPGDRVVRRTCEGDLSIQAGPLPQRSAGGTMETAQQHLAGMDVHKKMLAVVVRRERGERLEYEKRRFGTTRKEIERLAAWRQQEQVGEVVMESTAQYWRPVWYGWEAHFRLHRTHPLQTRAPRGRKWDFRDAQRLADR